MKNSADQKIRRVISLYSMAALALLIAAWVNPWFIGPSPVVGTLVFSWICAVSATCFIQAQSNSPTGEPFEFHFAAAWICAALLSSAIALLQYFQLGGALAPWVSPAAAGEAFANLRQRNQFATLTNMGLAVIFFAPGRWAFASGRLRVTGALAIVLLAIANAASSSRTGLLETILLLGLFFQWCRSQRGIRQDRRVLLTIVIYLSTALLLHWLSQEHQVGSGGILSRAPESAAGCGSRKVLWSNVLHLIAQKPWAGWGWGELDYAHFITLYPGLRFCDILDNAHNLPLQLAVELGLPLATLLCGGFGIWVWRQAPWRETQPTRRLAWAVLAVIGLHSLLEYPLWYGPFQMAVLMCLWMLRTPSSTSKSKAALAHTIFVVAAPLLIAFLGFVGWDYWRVSLLYKNPIERPVAYRDNTLEEARKTGIFQNQVQFAELTTKLLTRSNAEYRNRQALQLLHFSPEPAVVEAIIESAVLMGDDAQALYYLQRYKAAFADPHALWVRKSSAFQRPEWAGSDKAP